jgi:hypothetical protein
VTRSKYDGTRLEQLLESFLGGGSLADCASEPIAAANPPAATAAAVHESGRASSAPASGLGAAADAKPHTRRSISALAVSCETDAKDLGLVDLGGASPADLPPLQERPPIEPLRRRLRQSRLASRRVSPLVSCISLIASLHLSQLWSILFSAAQERPWRRGLSFEQFTDEAVASARPRPAVALVSTLTSVAPPQINVFRRSVLRPLRGKAIN